MQALTGSIDAVAVREPPDQRRCRRRNRPRRSLPWCRAAPALERSQSSSVSVRSEIGELAAAVEEQAQFGAVMRPDLLSSPDRSNSRRARRAAARGNARRLGDAETDRHLVEECRLGSMTLRPQIVARLEDQLIVAGLESSPASSGASQRPSCWSGPTAAGGADRPGCGTATATGPRPVCRKRCREHGLSSARRSMSTCLSPAHFPANDQLCAY